MIISHFNGNTRATVRLSGVLLLLALTLGGAFYLWAQGDTPIVIGDGSLTMDSATPWSRYSGTGRTRTHPETGKAVPTVTVTLGGTPQPPITFTRQKCTVAVTYGSTLITVATGNNGRRLQVTTDFSSFHPGDTPNLLVHNDPNQKISHVKVMRGNQTVLDQDTSGGTRIVIDYQ